MIMYELMSIVNFHRWIELIKGLGVCIYIVYITSMFRPVGRGVRAGSLKPPFWLPKKFICTV